MVGGAANQNKRQQIYNQAYWECKNSGRGFGPADLRHPASRRADYGEQWWMEACASKYRSFKWDGPHAGQFKGFDGAWHWCSL